MGKVERKRKKNYKIKENKIELTCKVSETGRRAYLDPVEEKERRKKSGRRKGWEDRQICEKGNKNKIWKQSIKKGADMRVVCVYDLQR